MAKTKPPRDSDHKGYIRKDGFHSHAHMKPGAATREEVEAWLAEHPESTAADLVAQFPKNGITTIRTWAKGWRKRHGLATPVGANQAPAPGTGTERAHVHNMIKEDRERILDTVRDGHEILRDMMARLRAMVKAYPRGKVPVLDRDTGQVLLSIERTTSGLVTTHPGVLALAQQSEDGNTPTKADLKEVLKAAGYKDSKSKKKD